MKDLGSKEVGAVDVAHGVMKREREKGARRGRETAAKISPLAVTRAVVEGRKKQTATACVEVQFFAALTHFLLPPFSIRSSLSAFSLCHHSFLFLQPCHTRQSIFPSPPTVLLLCELI